MLKAYVRRYDGTTHVVSVPPTGEHLSVHEGRVRVARMYWDRGAVKDSGTEAELSILTESVPLLDTLVLARVDARGERAVFHGLLTEVHADGDMVNLMAVDDPNTEALYDQAWHAEASLYPSDQAPPEQPQYAVPGAQPHAQSVQPVGRATVHLQTLGGQHVQAPNDQSSHPAARPGGHPAAPPAGSWQRTPPRATADA